MSRYLYQTGKAIVPDFENHRIKWGQIIAKRQVFIYMQGLAPDPE